MAQTQFQRVTDLSRLNWKGWVLVLITASVMFTAIILSGIGNGPGGILDAGGGEMLIIPYLMAFAAFGGLILVATVLRKYGVSIYQDGMDPFVENKETANAHPTDAERIEPEHGVPDLWDE
ncbi:MAG: hypothetical protein KDA78_02745 [Planctomycetaceae bacterium]|nr:hypothetical protein [Planctomycetaceae bacterium]